MDFQQWILTEDIRITVTSNAIDDSELLVERVFGPGAVLLNSGYGGGITANGQDTDLGDDFMAYCGIFDHVMDSHPTENPEDDMAEWPPIGFTCEMQNEYHGDEAIPEERSAVRAAVSAIMAASIPEWRPRDAENIIVNADGTWCSPGTFDSTRGTWELSYGQMIVKVDAE